MVDGEIFHIEPEGTSLTSRHIVYRDSDSVLPAGKCGKPNNYFLCRLSR